MVRLTGIFNKHYTLEMLESYLKQRQELLKHNFSYRCKILIIDDDINSDKYPLHEELELLRSSNEYNITVKTDLQDLNDAAVYDLIICDNQGIGLKICGSAGNGISLLKALTSEYPGKRYVMLSNQDIKINRLTAFSKLSNKISVWDKDDLAWQYSHNGEGGLADLIKKEVSLTLNPIERWKEIRRSFVINTNINLYDLARIEEAYIKSIIKNKASIYENSVNKLATPDDENGRISSYLKATKAVIEFSIAILSVL